jgi:elongation factor P
VIRFRGDLYRIVEFQHVKPGKGGAFVRTKLKNLLSGKVIDETWNAGASVETVRLAQRPIQYLYSGGNEFHFMDTETYEQLTVPEEMLKEYLPYLVESMTLELVCEEATGNYLYVDFPQTVVLTVTEAHDAARGDSAGAITKSVKVETGYEITVPPFIKEGEKIKIDTTTGKYIERA